MNAGLLTHVENLKADAESGLGAPTILPSSQVNVALTSLQVCPFPEIDFE
ncbi:MAG: hypothetical protein QG568_237 [Patescibacteria group bacterium]|nr:hypothetical protein [Patescibacteria group bacterium]